MVNFKNKAMNNADCGEYVVRTLTEADMEAFRAVRLEALRDNPVAFGGEYEEELQAPKDYFTGIFKKSTWFGGWQDNRLYGIAGLEIMPPVKLRHRASLWGMYVHPDFRASGMADALMTQALECAKQQNVEQVELHVMDPNTSARRFYERHGFREIGRTPHAIKLRDGSYHDDTILLRFVTEDSA